MAVTAPQMFKCVCLRVCFRPVSDMTGGLAVGGGGVCPVNHSLDILFLSSRPRALCMTNETFGGGKKAETKVCIRPRDRTVLWWASRVFSYDYLISEEWYERLCSQAQLFSYPSPTLINSISISSADMLHKLNTLKRCGKMTFLPLPGTLICADTLRCLFVGERWGGEAALLELWLKEKKKEKDWKKSRGWLSTGWFHLVSSDSHRRQAQSLPLSHWAAGGHVLNQQG